MKKDNPHDQYYAGEDYYYGKGPSSICSRVLQFVRLREGFRPKLIDVGCGEGRNAVFFAQQGFEVVALDASVAGVKKTRRLAQEKNVNVETIHSDMTTYEPQSSYDVVFSTWALHYLLPDRRERWFMRYKTATTSKGIHVMSCFVNKPFLAKAPDTEPTAHPYKSGELLGYYWDWEMLYCTEEIFDCTSSGVPHKHAVNRVIARRYKEESIE